MHQIDIDPVIREKARNVKLLALDVDGVLTSGKIYYSYQGDILQDFHVHDGLGLKLLQKNNIEIAIISSRHSNAVSHRFNELKINRLYQGVKNKLEVLHRIVDEISIELKNVCYIGDDLVDLPILLRVGFSVAVKNASSLIFPYVHYVTKNNGGEGAVREVSEIILISQDKLITTLNEFIN